MILRTGEPGDADGLTALLEAAFLDYARGIGRAAPGPYDWLPERLAAGGIEVAETNGTLLGMVALSHDAEAARLTVDLLAVDPVAQGGGVGRCLLAHAETRARALGAAVMTLHTVAAYDRLLRLYRSAGFEVTHLGPRPRGDDGHPRAFLEKRLSGGTIPA
jgi:GNAT superfamily N-acetyltransferase